MIEVRVLGLQALRDPDGREFTSLPAQPKRFALLAYLALGEGGGYHRRDTLAAMFWPDLGQFAARRALRNTLYHLREALGDGVIVTRGDDVVSVDAARLTSDVTMLRHAVTAGRYEEAVDFYRGELLAGIHFPNAGEEFEQWLAGERRRVTELVMRALGALVEREARGGNVANAAYWAQRASSIDPLNEALVRRAMEFLDGAGDTGGALRLYESYARRLATEFDAEPSAETETVTTRIRGGRRSDISASRATTTATPRSGQVAHAVIEIASDAGEAAGAGAPVATPIEESPSQDSVTAPSTRLWRGIVAAAGIVGVVAATALLIARARTSPPPNARQRVLITVFENRTGDPTLQAFGRMTQDWLAQGIVRAGLADVVDARAVFVQTHSAPHVTDDPLALAHRTGAGLVVSGNYYRTGDTLLIQASVTDVSTSRIVRAIGPILAKSGDPVSGLDDLRSRVMSALASVVDAHATQSLDASEVPRFDAYQAYVEGWDAFWHGDGAQAQALFLRAARLDTAFTAAALAAATASANSNRCGFVDSLTQALGMRAHALTTLDRLALQIASARCRGRNEEMLQLSLERADLDPGNSGNQMSAAAAALWANRPRRVLELLGRINPAIDLAWSTDTTHSAYWGDLTEALHALGRHREELDSADRMTPGAPLTRVWLRGSALAALARSADVLAMLDTSITLPFETASDIGLAPYTDGRPQYTVTFGWVANWISRELAYHGDTATARKVASRAVAWYRSRSVEERSTVEERLVYAWSLEMTGAYPEAERVARQLVAEDSGNVDFRGELAGLAAERGDTAMAGSMDRWLAVQPSSRVSWSASIYRARVAALLGRTDEAVARTRDAIDEGMWPRWLHQEPALVALRHRPDFIGLTALRD